MRISPYAADPAITAITHPCMHVHTYTTRTQLFKSSTSKGREVFFKGVKGSHLNIDFVLKNNKKYD